MHRWNVLAGVLLGSGWWAPLPAQQRLPDSELQAVLSQWATEHRLIGVAIGRWEGGTSSVVTAGVRRLGSDSAIRPRSDFEAGSITKAFTGTLLADMVLHGEVALDDPVAKYLPGWTLPSYNGQPITLLDLATHSSGLPTLPDNFRPTDPDDPYIGYTESQLIDFLKGYRLTRAPGVTYAYSNLGMALLGVALAKRAGTSYETLLRTRILDPLGMHDSHLSLVQSQQALAATPHTTDLRPTKPWHLELFAAAGGIHSTAPDLLKFADALRDTTTGPIARAMAFAIRPRRPFRGADSIGLAWHHLHLNGADIVWHNGGTGGFRSFLGADVKTHRAVVVLANVGGEFPADAMGVGLLRGGPLTPPPAVNVAPEITLTAEALEPLVGRYTLSPQFAIEVTREGNRLYAQATGQQRFALSPESATTFAIKAVKAELLFQLDAKGVVTGLLLRQNGIDQTARRVR